MVKIVQNFKYFTIAYSLLIGLILCARIFNFPNDYIIFSRPLIIVPLLIYYLMNNEETKYLKQIFIVGVLICFFIAEFFIALYEFQSKGLSLESVIFYIIGKVLLVAHFSNQKEFNIKRLISFFIFIFILIIIIMSLIYSNLGAMFLPILVYLFVSVVLLQFTLMRKNDVNASSYLAVLYGMIAMTIGDCLPALKFFYFDNQYISHTVIILVFSISHFFTFTGITKERKKENLNTIN